VSDTADDGIVSLNLCGAMVVTANKPPPRPPISSSLSATHYPPLRANTNALAPALSFTCTWHRTPGFTVECHLVKRPWGLRKAPLWRRNCPAMRGALAVPYARRRPARVVGARTLGVGAANSRWLSA